MKIYQVISAILVGVGMICGTSYADFDWGEGSGQCSGDGTFQQDIPYYDIIEVGEIPSGKQDVFIELISDKDVDIQLYDQSTGEKIVHWPDGILAGPGTQSTTYHGIDIEWSGYGGDGTGLGHEYIHITGTTNRTFEMKAFGYNAGYANVNYSWEGTEGCSGDGGPAESGSGTFQQQIAYYDIVEVGDLVPGLTNVYIELISDEDVDIQLYDGDTKIVHWPDGMLSGSSYQSTGYGGMIIEWSGYNGDGTGFGHEYIRITGSVDRVLTMKAFGYKAGYATVNYSWGSGDLEDPPVAGIDDLNGVKSDTTGNTWTISGRAIDSKGNPVADATIGIHDPISLMSYQIQCDSNGRFSFHSTKIYQGDFLNCAYTFDFLDPAGALIGQYTIYEEINLPGYNNLNTASFQASLIPVYGSQISDNNSSLPVSNTLEMMSHHFDLPDQNLTLEEQKGFWDDVADDMLNNFQEDYFSWSDVGFYTITFAGATGACIASGLSGCAPAYVVMGKAWADYAVQDFVFNTAEIANEQAVQHGVYNENAGTYIKASIVGGKTVLAMVQVHEAADHLDQLSGYAEFAGMTPIIQAGMAWETAEVVAIGQTIMDLLNESLSGF